MMNKGTGLGPELALTGMKRCEDPGYLKDELLVFRDQDPVLREFEIKIFHQKKTHCG